MEKIQRNNLCLYILLGLIVVLGCLVFMVYNYNYQKQSPQICDLISITIVSDTKTEKIKCWHSEGEDMYYAFLPAGAKKIEIHAIQGYNVSIEGMDDTKTIKVNALQLNETYNCNILDDTEIYCTGKLKFMQSANIPALFITTDSGQMEYINKQKGNSEKGTYSIWDSKKSNELSGMLSEICGRGNTSWTDCEKKGYKFVLQQPEKLLGLYESDTYLLIANARSNYLSNTIAFWLEEQIGIENVTKCEPLDLYFNGEYAGNYILCERIHIGETGINITNLEELNEQVNEGQKVEELEQYVSKDGNLKSVLWNYEPSDISGGYLIERDVPEYYADEKSGFILTSGDHYVIKSPKYASKREAEYIYKYMQDAHDAIADSKGYNSTTGKYYDEYIDIESFALKYMLEEFLAFNDSGRSSAYYYKEQNDVLYAGPGWDFEGAFLGNSQYLTLLNGTEYSTDLYERLWQHEEFRDLVIKNYNKRLKPAVSLLLSNVFVDMKEEIYASVAMDTIRWNRTDFLADCDKIATWLDERIEFLNKHWNEEENFITIKVQSAWENNIYIYLYKGNVLNSNELPQYVRDGYKFGGWINEDSGELFDFSQELYEDITLQALWISVNQSTAKIVFHKTKQIIPEILFAILFSGASVLFLIKTKRGGNKR